MIDVTKTSTAASRHDEFWFNTHPARQFHLRRGIGDELKPTPGVPWLVAPAYVMVRQLPSGERARKTMPVQMSACEYERLPDTDQVYSLIWTALSDPEAGDCAGEVLERLRQRYASQ